MIFKIHSGFSNTDWKKLKQELPDDGTLSESWDKAIAVFSRRMTERYFSCIDALIRADTKPDTRGGHDLSENECAPGFSIIALCCLLVESIQDFREATTRAEAASGPCPFPSGGCIKPSSGTNEIFRRFLNLPGFGGAFSDNQIAVDFMRGVRNGILHEVETRNWVIWRSLPPDQIVQKLEGRRYRLNRTLFYGAIRSEFDRYLRNLKEADNNALRVRFMKKMDGICKGTRSRGQESR